MTRQIGLAVLVGGLVAATIDVGAACLITGRSPERILQTIAGGVLGMRSFSLGANSALLGLAFQEIMGLIIASTYIFVGSHIVVPRNACARGAIYGVVIFIVMNFVVVPLSAWRRFPRFTASTFTENLLAMLLFGTIIALAAEAVASRSRGKARTATTI